MKMSDKEKIDRAEHKKAAKEEKRKAEQLERMQNQQRVSRIAITVEWKKSRTWGANPHLTAKVWGVDSFIGEFNYTTSGCGFDKESEVISKIFNEVLLYKLFLVGKEGKPYGIQLRNDYPPYYEGGVGTDCYYKIAEFIGGEFKRTANGKTFTAYEYIDNGTLQ